MRECAISYLKDLFEEIAQDNENVYIAPHIPQELLTKYSERLEIDAKDIHVLLFNIFEYPAIFTDTRMCIVQEDDDGLYWYKTKYSHLNTIEVDRNLGVVIATKDNDKRFISPLKHTYQQNRILQTKLERLIHEIGEDEEWKFFYCKMVIAGVKEAMYPDPIDDKRQVAIFSLMQRLNLGGTTRQRLREYFMRIQNDEDLIYAMADDVNEILAREDEDKVADILVSLYKDILIICGMEYVKGVREVSSFLEDYEFEVIKDFVKWRDKVSQGLGDDEASRQLQDLLKRAENAPRIDMREGLRLTTEFSDLLKLEVESALFLTGGLIGLSLAAYNAYRYFSNKSDTKEKSNQLRLAITQKVITHLQETLTMIMQDMNVVIKRLHAITEEIFKQQAEIAEMQKEIAIQKAQKGYLTDEAKKLEATCLQQQEFIKYLMAQKEQAQDITNFYQEINSKIDVEKGRQEKSL